MNTDSTKEELLDDFESIASDAGIDRNALLTAYMVAVSTGADDTDKDVSLADAVDLPTV